MSRTFRRKNYEHTQGDSWGMTGTRIGGRHVHKDSYRVDCGEFYRYVYTYREPTRAEYFKKYWRLHGESDNRNAWSPNRFHRAYRMKENRMINKQELYRCVMIDEYEPLFEADPRNCWWDWD